MSSVLLPIQWGGLAQGYCFSGWNQLGLDISNAQKAVLASGMSFFNYGDTQPVPEYQGYPWLYTVDMRWYRYTGQWISPNPFGPGRHLWEEFNSESDVWSFDGGDGTDPSTSPPTPNKGAMWMVDHGYDGRSPMGVGSVPGATVPLSIVSGTDAGNAEHTLTEAEGAVGQHTHAFGITNAGGDDAFFAKSGVNTVANYTGFYITGNGPNLVLSETTADLFTLPSGLGGTGVTAPTPFKIIHPVRGMYCIVRTSRINYTVP